MKARCPSCTWVPVPGDWWHCEHCLMEIDLFGDAGRCPYCAHQHHLAPCVPWRGGCDAIHPLLDWIEGLDDALRQIHIIRPPGPDEID